MSSFPRTDFTGKIKSINDIKEREKAFCEWLWNFVIFLTIDDSIPTTPEETDELIKIIDWCAKQCFREDIQRKEHTIDLPSRAEGNLGKKVSIEEVEHKHMTTMPSGEKVPFGYGNREWVELKMFIREKDELWEYRTGEESWENLAGREGVALVRDGYIVGEILTEMN